MQASTYYTVLRRLKRSHRMDYRWHSWNRFAGTWYFSIPLMRRPAVSMRCFKIDRKPESHYDEARLLCRYVTSFDKWHNARRADSLLMEHSKTRLIAQEMQKRHVCVVWQMDTALRFINEQLPGDAPRESTLAHSRDSTKLIIITKNFDWPKHKINV